MHLPEIIIQTPNARLVIQFDRTAAACWRLVWPAFAGREEETFRSLAEAMSAIADFTVRTEF